MKNINFEKLRNLISKQKKVVKEMISTKNFIKEADSTEKKILTEQYSNLKDYLKKLNRETETTLNNINVTKPLSHEPERAEIKEEPSLTQPSEEKKEYHQLEFPTPIVIKKRYSWKEMKPDRLENETFKRITTSGSKKSIQKVDLRDVDPFVKFANKLFSKTSKKLVDEKTFENLEKDLIKANIQMAPQEYLSTTLLASITSIFIAGIIALFFLFFKITPDLPIIVRVTEEVSVRILKVFWLIFVIPVATLLIMFFYPSMEKSAMGNKMDQEMPFATMHMAAISGSMINPTNIFEIIISTKEYPHLAGQFTKLINEINIYGYDIVSALRNAASNCPSKKLSELYNGLATTINSGGSLPGFFEKRAQTLLFEYGLEKEKRTKAAETFMDIYISVVIAAPMILMILLMMMKLSGLGISLSTQMITIIMIVAVSIINVIFISFLEVKK